MSAVSNQQLCQSLIQAEEESDVISILKENGYWEDDTAWSFYGDRENNFSTAGNQQSKAEAALAEKLINSVDAVLMRECQKHNIKPDSEEAPKSMEDALRLFFGIYEGKLSEIDTKIRGELANNIYLVASGSKSSPSLTIIDKGEGQSPNSFPKTFLSLSESNKLRIPFVQGKFNMGATGSLRFCGLNRNNIQLIVSKRSPDIKGDLETDNSHDKWGFTIIRRERPKNGMRSSSYKYLMPNRQILSFTAENILALPDSEGHAYSNKLDSGSIIKLYEYQLAGGLKTNIKFDLYYKLSLLLPNIALPISFYETRSYRQESAKSIMSGLSVRLDEDKRDNVEENYPSTSEIQVFGEKVKAQIYAFKKDQGKKYTLGEGIIFSVNGQTHATLPNAFFERKAVGMSQISDSILVIVDCSLLSKGTIEDLFMNSRDRLSEGEVKIEIVKQLEEIIRNHPGLKELRERRRQEAIADILKDSKPLADVLNKVINKSPTLTRLFSLGLTIQNPLNLSTVKTQKKYIGKKYPTFFKLLKKHSPETPKECHINQKFKIQYATDADNDYFDRNSNPATFNLEWEGVKIETFNNNLWNGINTLNVTLPECVALNDVLTLKSVVQDDSGSDPFVEEFTIRIIEPAKSGPGIPPPKPNDPTDPPDDKPGNDRTNKGRLNIPNIYPCRIDQGDNYKFKDDKEGALIVYDNAENGYDFYINMDNLHLRNEIKGDSKTDPQILESRYKFGMVLIGLSCLYAWEKQEENEDMSNAESTLKKIYNFTRAVSPILLPMIGGLGDIQIEE